MSRTLRTTIGVLLSLLLLAWALRDVSFSEVLLRIRAADPVLLTISIVVTLMGFYIRALRWGILLAPVQASIPYRPRLAATFIGFAANNVLPARIGEFARAFSLSRLVRIRTASAFATLVVERLLDALVLVALLFLSMAAPGFPENVRIAGIDLRQSAIVMAVVMVAVGIVLLLGVVYRDKAAWMFHLGAKRLPARARGPLREILSSFATGLAVLRTPSLFLVSLVLAAAQWLFLAVSFLLAFRAFEIDTVPFSGAIFLQSLISLAVAIPSSPGFFGPFEAASRIGLSVWGVPEVQAISFAIGYHIAGFLPVTLIGIYYVWRLDLTWSDVRESEESVEEELHEDERPASSGKK